MFWQDYSALCSSGNGKYWQLIFTEDRVQGVGDTATPETDRGPDSTVLTLQARKGDG